MHICNIFSIKQLANSNLMQVYIESVIRLGSTRTKLPTFLNQSRSICGSTTQSLVFIQLDTMSQTDQPPTRFLGHREVLNMLIIVVLLFSSFTTISSCSSFFSIKITTKIYRTANASHLSISYSHSDEAISYYNVLLISAALCSYIVHMANDRDKWRTITGLNGPHGS